MTPPIDSPYSGQSPFNKIARWMNVRREARRARQDEEKAVDLLRSMGPKLAKDIGVDINKLGMPESPERKMQKSRRCAAGITTRFDPVSVTSGFGWRRLPHSGPTPGMGLFFVR